MKRIFLSPPHMSGREQEFVREAFETNWVAPLGPHVDAFEREFAATISGGTPNATCQTPDDERGAMSSPLSTQSRKARSDERGAMSSELSTHDPAFSPGPLYATALSSGTAALHLALRLLAQDEKTEEGRREPGVGGRRTKNDGRSNEVICSTFTFAASANAITYEGLTPVFIDSDATSWNMDPDLLREELADCAQRGKLPRAVIAVDLYGQCANYDPIVRACDEFGVPLIEDAAEALGAVYWGTGESPEFRIQSSESRSEEAEGRIADSESHPKDTKTQRAQDEERRTKNARQAGSFGRCAAFSFNGNKIITTGGGGMLVSHEKAITEKARFLATQARDPGPHYQHSEIGFNYRLSNVLAAIGRGQLALLSERVAARRGNFEFYQQALGDLPGIEFMPEAPFGRCTRWLTCLTIDPKAGGATTHDVRLALAKESIEARPLWKPMHLQPVFAGCRARGGGVSERLFESGLCLPSGSSLTREDLERICTVVRRVLLRTSGK